MLFVRLKVQFILLVWLCPVDRNNCLVIALLHFVKILVCSCLQHSRCLGSNIPATLVQQILEVIVCLLCVLSHRGRFATVFWVLAPTLSVFSQPGW